MTYKSKFPVTEHKLQVQLMDYLSYAATPGIRYFAIPNGEKRHISVAQRLKAEGVRRGTPDLCFLLPKGKVGWLEMKKPGGSLSPDQKSFRDDCLVLGHLWAMASSVDEALQHLTIWGCLKPAYRRDPKVFKTDHLETIKLETSNV